MTGPWESRLTALADRDGDWSLPGAQDLEDQLEALQPVLRAAQEQHGLTGSAGDAATASLVAAYNSAAKLVAAITTVHSAMDAANQARGIAAEALQQLPQGELDSGTAAAINAVATGVTIPLGPISVVAGPYAVHAVNDWLSNRRETAAKAAVDSVSAAIEHVATTQIDPGDDPSGGRQGFWTGQSDTAAGGTSTTPAPGSSGENQQATSLPPAHSSITDHTAQTGDGSWTGASTSIPPLTAPNPGALGPTSPVATIPPVTVDGPIAGGVGDIGSLGGLGTGGAGSGIGGGLGSGAGGALGGLGSIGGSAIAGGVGAAAALGADRLLRGGIGGAGGGVGTVGGIGGARLGGLGATADAGGTGGLRGGTKTGATRAAASAAAGADGAEGRAGVGGMMGGGAPGGSPEKRAARGLGGPIAPKLDDDADAAPRTRAAGAGGRE